MVGIALKRSIWPCFHLIAKSMRRPVPIWGHITFGRPSMWQRGQMFDFRDQSSVLCVFLQNRSTDFGYGVGMISDFAEFLTNMQNRSAFHINFESAVVIIGQPSSRPDRKHNYKQLYFQMTDSTVAMLYDQFADCKHSSFLDLVNLNFFAKWKAEFPADRVQLLKSKYDPLLMSNYWKPIAC